ncbi:MAG: 4-hydroxy-tetrahydrodipicolinate reductase [Bacteroides sp.]|nr:4-hydroxy-tetrahydrodipicolinate reductase [Bacteroides sp.]MCM1379709.1 4-hydroxy-tetrahydrodipicolinate reductase [Bacteroides sp.]MCM1446064.1 4-hydroxy-tetrahydrodipicolinate reductase [Prevotella sp.]
MKIALIGYGKMGHIIEQLALSRGHEIVAKVDKDTEVKIDSPEFRSADVAIEFSVPSAAEANVGEALRQGVSVVCGTTGWADGLERVKAAMPAGVALMWSGNYSLGVNLFFAANRFIAKMMSKFPQYVPDLTETHHIHKLDHPSGTALMTAEQIINEVDSLNGWSEEPAPGKLLINHIRHAEVPGIHRVTWESDVDSITLEHSAKSRAGFALGAVMAAEWLAGKSGFHTIDEMMSEII